MKAGSFARSESLRRVCAVLLVLLPSWCDAQGRRGGGRGGGGRGGGGATYLDDFTDQAMSWPINPAFKEDVFVFARLKHQSGGGYGYARRASWQEDYPLADIMLPYRVHQTTAIAVRPGPNPIDFEKEELAKCPFIYLAGVETMALQEREVTSLRSYLLNGGFMMVDNFWGDAAWTNFARQMKRVFPDRTATELQLEHPIFHVVYDFKAKAQMPSTGVWMNFGVFYDPNRDYDVMGHDPHYFAFFDDKGRLMMIICHNNHYGDGWEHESDDIDYFHVISEGMAYPMFINILMYAMTH